MRRGAATFESAHAHARSARTGTVFTGSAVGDFDSHAGRLPAGLSPTGRTLIRLVFSIALSPAMFGEPLRRLPCSSDDDNNRSASEGKIDYSMG
jgi:hypothetical protein